MPFDCTPSETIPAPLTLDDLIAWLRTKPADEAYCYMSNGHCLWGQYLIERGLAERPWVYGTSWGEIDAPDQLRRLLPGVRNIEDFDGWGADVAVKKPRTFGAALARALTYAATGKV